MTEGTPLGPWAVSASVTGQRLPDVSGLSLPVTLGCKMDFSWGEQLGDTGSYPLKLTLHMGLLHWRN